jgi:hypothetical protein
MGFLLVSVARRYEARHQKETRGSPSGYVYFSIKGTNVVRKHI